MSGQVGVRGGGLLMLGLILLPLIIIVVKYLLLPTTDYE